jgi:hypothetical protein
MRETQTDVIGGSRADLSVHTLPIYRYRRYHAQATSFFFQATMPLDQYYSTPGLAKV